MKKSQLNAIAYAYAEKKRRENRYKIVSLGLYSVFRAQKVYKTMTWFLKARDNYWKKYEKMINDIREKMYLEHKYEKRMYDNSLDFDDIIAHKKLASRFSVVETACERELDRIFNHAIIQYYRGAADGNR